MSNLRGYQEERVGRSLWRSVFLGPSFAQYFNDSLDGGMGRPLYNVWMMLVWSWQTGGRFWNQSDAIAVLQGGKRIQMGKCTLRNASLCSSRPRNDPGWGWMHKIRISQTQNDVKKPGQTYSGMYYQGVWDRGGNYSAAVTASGISAGCCV